MHASTAIVLSLLALAYVPSAFSANGAPYINSVFPKESSKEGGARITITGAGFEDTPYLKAKFSRVEPESDQVIEKETECDYKSSTEIVCESPSWDEATCPYCNKQSDGSTCLPGCANRYPWDNTASHANVLMDDASAHYNAEGNHHVLAGMGGARGKYPVPSAANEYDEHDNPNGQWPLGWKNSQNAVQTATTFFGHHGSPFLRSNSKLTITEIGQGGFIKIGAQFFTVARIETCEAGVAGCWCDGEWGSDTLETNNTVPIDIGQYPVGPENLATPYDNTAMYAWDKKTGTHGTPTCAAYSGLSAEISALKNPDGSTVTFPNSGNFLAGTKITLDQPLYRQPGTPMSTYFTSEVYVSSKKACVDCKCAEGCALTMTVSNNGRTWSGGGTNGKTWHGSAGKYTAKFIIPEVHQIQFPNLKGRRDSTRMFIPSTGNTVLRVKGKHFQEGPLLRCYFNTPRIMVKAEYVDSETVLCQTPNFVARRQDMPVNTDPTLDNKCTDAFTGSDLNTQAQFANDIYDHTSSSRLFDTQCTNSMQNGAAAFDLISSGVTAASDWSFSHVQVTNNGKHQDLSAVIHKRDDGVQSYLEAEGSAHRSTCYQLAYPTTLLDSAVGPGYEQSEPCHGAHVKPDSGVIFSQGNDVQVKYSPCYEALASEPSSGGNYYLTEAAGKAQLVNSTTGLGQKFSLPASAAGPLVAVKLHLIKAQASAPAASCADTDDCAAADRQPTTLEVCVSAGGFKGKGQTLACEWITIQNIASTSKEYTVYFSKSPYLLAYYNPSTTPGFNGGDIFAAEYYLSVKHMSGPETLSWAMSDQTTGPALVGTNGYFFKPSDNSTSPVEANHGFRASFYTCDGCRWQYQSLHPADDTTSYQIGRITGRQNQSESYLATHPSATCKSTDGQAMGRSYRNEGYDTAEGLARVNSAEDPSGVYGDECGTPTYREQMAQAIRPLEDVTVSKMRTKMRVAYSPDSGVGSTHEERTESGDFKAAIGASVSTWITEFGKLGEYVCHTFTGETVTSDVGDGWKDAYAAPSGVATNAAAFGAAASGTDLMLGCGENNKDCMHCDSNGDGKYSELCFLGALCNKTLPGVFGGCGVKGICAMSKVVTNAHVLRNHPDGSGPFTSRCGEDVDCENSQALKVQHSVQLAESTSISDQQDVIWEFDHPVVLNKHTTYYVNMAIDETISKSDSVYWYAGSDGVLGGSVGPAGAGRTPFLASYGRKNVVIDTTVGSETSSQSMFVWVQNPTGVKFDLELMRCVTSLPSIASFSTSGAGTGSCLARSSPRGGLDGPTVTFKGRNFFPSGNLRAVFLYPDGSMGPTVDCVSTRYDFTEMECKAPSFNPFDGVDCTVPGSCEGVSVMATNDGLNYGPELFSPKFIEPYSDCTVARSPSGGCDAVPAMINNSHHFDDHFVQLLGENIQKYCFTDIYVSTSGSDYNGDGTYSRPFRTIQRGIDAANQHDVLILLAGTYTGTGNRGIRHMGKKIEVKTMESDPRSQNCWCATATGNQACFTKVGSASLVNTACTGEKKYISSTGISHRDTTIIDCQFHADGFVINNNKDSQSPFSGYVDFSDITTMNCENLRIYG